MKVLTAKKCIGEDGIYLVKECDIHGKFQTLIWEGTAAEYLSWGRENLSAETPVNPKIKEKSCPDNCGLCEEHERKGCCMILEVTKRCNMHCPVCFASAGECLENGDLSIDEIEKQYDFLMDHGGPFNIQLSGGEPTMRLSLIHIWRILSKERPSHSPRFRSDRSETIICGSSGAIWPAVSTALNKGLQYILDILSDNSSLRRTACKCPSMEMCIRDSYSTMPCSFP